MSHSEYTISDRIWAMIGASLFIAITCAVFTLAVSFGFFMGGGDTLFFIPLFVGSFVSLMVLQILFPKLLPSLLGNIWHLITNLFTWLH